MVGATGSDQTAKARSTATALSFNASTNVLTASQLDLSASSSANDSVLYLSGTPTSASGTNGLLGIGALSFSDTDIIANFVHDVNGYAQVVVQNKNSGASSSADIIVNNDRAAGTTYYGDFGINGTTFSAGGVFGDVDGTYLYAAGGTLSLGSLNDYAVKIATNNTERVRINATGVGIGTTNPQSQLHITGQFQSTQANSTTTGGGQIYLNGATGNRIDFNQNGIGAPTFTTRSAGTKLVLYPSVGGSGVDYAVGMDSSTLWFSIETNSSRQFRWYGGTTQLADLKGSGEFLLGSTSIVSSAKLQVTGGAYVSDSVGIGTTNPEKLLHLSTSVATPLIIQRTTAGNSAIEYRNTTSSMWAGIPTNASGWGVGPTENIGTGAQILVTRTGGELLVGRLTATGTSSQKLQVESGAYVSGNLGVGVTNPGATLNVVPTATSIAGLFSGTTSSDMVRITQLGSGNALVVEDSANPDSSPFVVTGIGSVGIGTASPAFTADIAGDARVTSTNKMRFGGTAGTTNFYIQYNSTANSLDFVAG